MRTFTWFFSISIRPIVAALLVAGAGATAIAADEATKPAPIRINAGAYEAVKDADGNTWLPDQGFDGGDVIDRGDIEIGNTKNPAVYRTERYSMMGFTHRLPNGKYTVKLHFAETYEEIGSAGQRVFSFNVEGKDFKNFDVFQKAGGARRAYVETVEVEIADGKLDITFTAEVENPEINGIEILPAA